MDKTKPTVDIPKKELEDNLKELHRLRDVRISFMKEQMPFLELEASFTKHRADIAENTYREQLSKMKYAELTAPRETPADEKPKV